LEIIRELQDSGYDERLSIKEIANRFIEQHGEDFERKITPHWIGHIVRRKLGLKTERKEAGYVIAATEAPNLARLHEKYGISGDEGGRVNLVNSVNSVEEIEPPPHGPAPLII
jgi:hypothetical protein